MHKKKILIVCNSEFAYQKFLKETYLELKKKYHVDVLIGLEDNMKKNLIIGLFQPSKLKNLKEFQEEKMIKLMPKILLYTA